jgi:gamma-glutamyltranspeptidase/glutathione hydrolase
MSNYHGFGTAVVPEGCGFPLQNRGCAFSLDPESPNRLEGGKRPYHTIIPAMVTRGDELFMSFGVMGGVMQPQGHVQVLLNLVHNSRSPQLALEAKRFCVGGTQHWGSKEAFYNTCVGIEDGVAEETIDRLEKMGHEIERIKGAEQCFFGKGQIILPTVDPVSGRRVWAAGSDYRGDGCAVPQI